MIKRLGYVFVRPYLEYKKYLNFSPLTLLKRLKNTMIFFSLLCEAIPKLCLKFWNVKERKYDDEMYKKWKILFESL